MTTPASEHSAPYALLDGEADHFFNLTSQLLCIASFDGYFKRLNPAWEKALGFTIEELLSKPCLAIVHREDRERTDAAWKELAARAQTLAFENRCLTKAGYYRWISWVATSLPDRGLVYASVCDITDQKRRETEDSHLASLVKSSADAIVGTTLEGIIISWNAGAERVTGYADKEMKGRPFSSLLPSGQCKEMEEILARIRRGERVAQYDTHWVKKGGEAVQISMNVSPIRDAAGEIAGASTIANDISERKQAGEQLRHERFANALLESVQVGIVACDERGVLTLFNQVARSWHGLPAEPLPAEKWAEHYGWCLPHGRIPLKKEEVPLFRALEGERVSDVEMMIVPKQGEPRTVLASGRPILDSEGNKLGAVAAMIDITERKCLEQQFRHSQKMEAVGRLAGGVAHDFNNLLTIITGYGQMLQRSLEPGSSLRAYAEEVLKSGERAASLTRQLLAFSRRQDFSPRGLDLNTLVGNTENMLHRLIGEDIELVTVLPAGLGMVRGDHGQIEQVIFNLAVNARDAMPNGGHLTLETANVELDESFAHGHIPSKLGPYVMLAVTDTGCGMDAPTQAHIFEPFFTTKEPGKGTGLGLATVYGIVKQHGGNIWVYSELAQGTTFKIYLPRIDMGAAKVEERGVASRELRGSETILVAEDDQAVRSLVVRLLRSMGYWVLEASRVDEAQMVCLRHKGPVHLLLTDVVMPQMSGRDLLEHIKPLRPDIRVLFTSGYTEEALRRGELERDAAFLPKPFTEEALARKVRDVLDEGKEAKRHPPSTH
jgi:two-component system, cell cycle sensor histidine kinase and response regulator CckA